MLLDPERKILKAHFSEILYSYDCLGKNQISLNLFIPKKSMKLVPGLWPRDLYQVKSLLSRGGWFLTGPISPGTR